MSTTIYSEKKVSTGQPRWRLLGVDANGVHHLVREPSGEIVGVHRDRIVAREQPTDLESWVASVDAEIGWTDHPDATPGRRWFDEAISA